jgi:flagellar assembly factor FliW
MQIDTTRFGLVELSDEDLICFDGGIIGFPKERKLVLIPHAGSTSIAWLQSATTPGLAFPVVSAHGLVSDYPDVDLGPIAEKAGLSAETDGLAVLVVLCAPHHLPATVNLLAPILIDSETRRGAQVFLEGSRFTTRELFVTVPEAGSDQEGAEPRAGGRDEAHAG